MCFVGVREAGQQRAVKGILHIPEAMELICLLAFGYRAEVTKSPGTPRKPMEEIVQWGRFGGERESAIGPNGNRFGTSGWPAHRCGHP